MSCIALIPARGGSKGIHKKNLQKVGNLTLLQRTIRDALSSKIISKVFVSTEDEEISNHVLIEDVSIIKRPKELASDEASTESVIEHALNELDKDVDIIVLMQCTSPFRSQGQLDEALNIFNPLIYDSLVSVVPFHGYLWGKQKEKWIKFYKERRRRQDMDQEYFLETGSFYIFTKESFINHKNRIGKNVQCFVVPQHDALEIDSPFDLELARAMESYMKLY